MIILHPEFLKTINSINELKESIADLLEEKDYLTYYICRNIEVDYMLKVGFLESKLLELEVKIEKAKKRIKLIESYINEDKPINNEEIENKLSENFSEIESELNEMKKMVNFAFEYCNTDKYEISEDDITMILADKGPGIADIEKASLVLCTAVKYAALEKLLNSYQ